MFFLSLVPVLFSLPLIAAQNVGRDNTFIGCSATLGQTSYDSLTWSERYSWGMCTGRPNQMTYSAYQRSTKTCYCVNSPQPADQIRESGNAGSGSCTDSSQYSFYRIYTSFIFDRCYNTPDASLSTTTSNIADCFDFCRNYQLLQVRATNTDNLYTCSCPLTSDTPPSTVTVCDGSGNTVFRYTHSFAAASAGVVRRRRELSNNKKNKETFCPAGLKACKVPGVMDENAFECLDVISELESCGGCIAGEYGVDNSEESEMKGVNCMSGDNSEFSTITCRAGQCVNE